MAHRPGYRVDVAALTDRHDAGDQSAPAEGVQNLAQDHALGETKNSRGTNNDRSHLRQGEQKKLLLWQTS